MEPRKRRHTDMDERPPGDRLILTLSFVIICTLAVIGVVSIVYPSSTCHHALEERTDTRNK